MPDLGKTVSLCDWEHWPNYIEHQDERVDLACIDVSALDAHHEVFVHTLTSDILADLGSAIPCLGDDVWVAGYPDNHFDTRHNLPTLLRGSVATSPHINFEGRPEFLIDFRIGSGVTGGPVFAKIEGDHRLVGIISETTTYDGELLGGPAAVEGSGELGIVLKPRLIKELAESAVQEFTY